MPPQRHHRTASQNAIAKDSCAGRASRRAVMQDKRKAPAQKANAAGSAKPPDPVHWDSSCGEDDNVGTSAHARASRSTLTLANQPSKDAFRALAASKEQVGHLELELKQLKQQYAESMEELENSRRILDSYAGFLSVSILRSGAELKDILGSLNDEIAHHSAVIAELITSGGDSKDNLDDNSRFCADGILAHQLLERLRSSGSALRLAVFRKSLQGVLSWACQDLINDWTADDANCKLLEGIHASMKKEVLPSVSGRWKMLTRKYSNNTSRATLKQLVHKLTNDVLSLVRLMPDSSIVSKHRKDVGRSIESVLERAIQVDRALTEAATDEEWEAFCIRAGGKFDKKKMDKSTWSRSEGGEPVGLVVSSMGLGLKRTATGKSRRRWDIIHCEGGVG
ncbi:hypothetical protein PM082_015198 [Marasmius tenuissimus]|nr:hypothetical protein PM082_015198 [Marasmius tenuissimus]